MFYIHYNDNATNKNADKNDKSTDDSVGSKRPSTNNEDKNHNKRSKVRYLSSFCHQVIKSLR